MTLISSTRDLRSSEKTCVLFDADGRIRHVHTVVTVGGAKPQTEAEIERKAQHHAGLFQVKAPLIALHVPQAELQLGGPVMVDPKTRRVVRVRG
ncbi:hypothetical protein [Bradyrhizobium prioriisuperbiae]|uniref:hypothetical protein n=1 Tax=Bradyrhizobium prioriisuperbiae TaxID=2854389 RepID=UPI0028EC9B71|nr:hypothetical protein [Bradyrhizobium prioritasuperba]